MRCDSPVLGNLNDWRSLQREDLASLAGDFRRLGGYEALIASCISSFGRLHTGYVYGRHRPMLRSTTT